MDSCPCGQPACALADKSIPKHIRPALKYCPKRRPFLASCFEGSGNNEQDGFQSLRQPQLIGRLIRQMKVFGGLADGLQGIRRRACRTYTGYFSKELILRP